MRTSGLRLPTGLFSSDEKGVIVLPPGVVNLEFVPLDPLGLHLGKTREESFTLVAGEEREVILED